MNTRAGVPASTDVALVGAGVVGTFRAAARRSPATIAFRAGGDRITYGELAVASTTRGAQLRRAHAADRRPIAMVVDDSVDAVISILAVLSSGRPLVAVDASLPDVVRDHVVVAAGAVPADMADSCDPSSEPGVLWWESPEWDNGLTEGGHPTALDAWRPALVALGPGSTGRVVVTHEELATSATDLAVRAGLAPGDAFDLSHSPSSVAGLITLVAGLGAGCTVHAAGRGFPVAM